MAIKNEQRKGVSTAAGTDKIKLGGGEETRRIKLVREISELAHFSDILGYMIEALEKAKKRFKGSIVEFKGLKKDLEAKLKDDGQESKAYSFELRRIKDQETETGFSWELEEFRLGVAERTKKMIFSDFIKNIEQYEVEPNQFKTENVYSFLLDKWFQIKFARNSADRVVGLVKIMEEKFVIRENDTMLTVNTRTYRSLQKEKVLQLMEENPLISEDMAFYASLIQQAQGVR
ncbi:MAG: hypothetical protein KAW12_14115 [Candidatus Aminicenantes bacterium]|nr:hypothetical protein [Candidatus Aminicenantes bacterium]